MIMAIFIVVIIALGGTLILRNASTGSKSVSDNYLRTQAELLADSGIEFATMQMQGIDTAGGGTCLNGLNVTVQDQSGNPMYDVNATLTYSFVNPLAGSTAGCNKLTPDRIGTGNSMVLIDVTVTTRDDANLSTEPIRVHKRSWQKL
jgi:hypothetical protein